MPRGLYVDCFSGASGDMLLGALLDAGAPLDTLRDGLASLPVQGWSITHERVERQGLRGSHARVSLDAAPAQPHRHLATILEAIAASSLPSAVQMRASSVFRRLAEAEAHVHNTSVEEVHFHEVGAVDAIVDVVGVVYALYLLAGEDVQVFCSGLPLGAGWVRSEHGPLPVPGPAVAELVARAQAPTRRWPPVLDEPGELTTPTGAALLTTLSAGFRQPAFAKVERVGYGFGSKNFPWPNAVRVILGDLADTAGVLSDQVVQVETNLDDATPEQLGYAMERLLEAGALDVAFTPLQMKKNRPGVLLRVLAPPDRGRELAELVLLHTSALGVRVQSIDRLIARRASRQVQTPWGMVRVKEKHLADRVFYAPEYDDCAAVARQARVPLELVFQAARTSAEMPA